MRITSLQAIRILLDGGYIAEICLNICKARIYKVLSPYNTEDFSYYITRKQFKEMCEAGVIENCWDNTREKHGNISNLYILRRNF